MAKKNVDAVVVEDIIEDIAIEEDVAPADGAFKFDTDFDVEEEYKVPPLVPAAKYEAYVTNVKFDAAANALVWSLALKADDDVTMSDNETPVNGVTLEYKNWFPKAGDELERTKTGKMTKRQAKINMIKDFEKKMRINMNTPDAILEAVTSGDWIGLEVIATVIIREWEGRTSNQVNELSAM